MKTMKKIIIVDAIIQTPWGIVLGKRRYKPFGWALPGGHVEPNESLTDAVIREVKEETSMRVQEIQQFKTYIFNDIITIVFSMFSHNFPVTNPDELLQTKIFPHDSIPFYGINPGHRQVIQEFLANIL